MWTTSCLDGGRPCLGALWGAQAERSSPSSFRAHCERSSDILGAPHRPHSLRDTDPGPQSQDASTVLGEPRPSPASVCKLSPIPYQQPSPGATVCLSLRGCPASRAPHPDLTLTLSPPTSLWGQAPFSPSLCILPLALLGQPHPLDPRQLLAPLQFS